MRIAIDANVVNVGVGQQGRLNFAKADVFSVRQFDQVLLPV